MPNRPISACGVSRWLESYWEEMMKTLGAILALLVFSACPAGAQTVNCGQAGQATTDGGDANFLAATPCLTGSNQAGYQISEIAVWVGGASASIEVGVYDDASGAPGSLLCETSAPIVPKSGWNAISISGCPVLNPTTMYWLAQNTNSNSQEQGAVSGSCPAGSSSVWTSAKVKFGTWPSSFGASTPAYHGCYSEYALLSPLGSTTTLNITAKLLWTDGTPVAGALVVSQLISSTSKTWQSLGSFTLNTSGVASGTITWNSNDPLTFSFTLLDKSGNTVNSMTQTVTSIQITSLPVELSPTIVFDKESKAIRSFSF
jgi:hypothetical protein